MKIYLKRMRGKDKCPPRMPLSKIVWSWFGAFIGIFLISMLHRILGINVYLIGAFGASAVLVYGVPLAEFSQPRNVAGGHVLSALIGVGCFHLLAAEPDLAAAVAVSLAIAGMHLTRTLHPPGGATALIAVIGGERIHDLGLWYALNPVLLGAVVLILVALLVNNMSRNPKRHYPVYWL